MWGSARKGRQAGSVQARGGVSMSVWNHTNNCRPNAFSSLTVSVTMYWLIWVVARSWWS